MLRRCVFLGALAALTVFPALTAQAGLIRFNTGNVETDMPVQPGVIVVVDNPNPSPQGAVGLPTSNPNDIDIATWMRSENRQTGMNIKDLRLYYDDAADRMYVGVNMFGIAGDIDGDGNPSGTDARTQATGGLDVPRFGTGFTLPTGKQVSETILVAFDMDNDRKFDAIAGVPLDKTKAGPGLNGFTISKYVDTMAGLPYGFGETLYDHVGNLAFDPSAASPDFAFTIENFSKLPGANLSKNGFGVAAFAGTIGGIVIGEDSMPLTAVSAQAIVPEPASILGWTLLGAAGAVWGYRRRRPS
jgi:hypothetical protein